MKYRMMFSVPVHEKPEVIIDQIVNFKTMNPHSGIVIHLSASFDYASSWITRDEFMEILNDLDYVYLNPESVRTGKYDIIQTHLSNFAYIVDVVDFDYFCLCASNELFVRPGLENYIRKYDCGVGYGRQIEYGSKKKAKWVQLNYAKNDAALGGILSDVGGGRIIGSQVEGTFYKKALFSEISHVISRNYDYRKMTDAYAREEIYFSTIFWNRGGGSIGFPETASLPGFHGGASIPAMCGYGKLKGSGMGKAITIA